MDPAQFFTASRLVIVAGKGGVGKTTVTASLARAAARSGLSSLIVEVEGKSGLASMYGSPAFSYDEVTLAETDERAGTAAVRARTLTPDEALIEYLEDSGMGRISKRLLTSGALDMVATAIPGISDILVLGKIKQMERAKLADLLIVDGDVIADISILKKREAFITVMQGGVKKAGQLRDGDLWSSKMG